MKHLPNIITLGNLFFGCMAIVFILHAPPFLGNMNGEDFWVSTTSQVYYGSVCIFIAAICDFFDGLAARWLGVFSPLGKDLDSLADVVSFGVAPSMIFAKLLWMAWMKNPNALDISIWAISPAFLIACFGALRLARFNVMPSTTQFFTGVPIPAIGVVSASLPFIVMHNPLNAGSFINNVWVLLIIIAMLCWLMVSKIQIFTLKLSSFSFAKNRAQYLWLLFTLISIFCLKWLAIPFSFLLYISLSIAFKPNEE